jgi:hypothetical protein
LGVGMLGIGSLQALSALDAVQRKTDGVRL